MLETPLDFALYYASLGWAVLPLHTVDELGHCSCNEPCASPGKHPRTASGCKDATTDEDVLAAWWAAHPDSNVGIATGSVSMIWVLDLDLRDDGVGRFEAFRAGRALKAVSQQTGSGAAQLVFTLPDIEVRNRRNVLPGVDVRGEGGYIVAPPSHHASGGVYKWNENGTPEPVLAPSWLLELVCGEAPATKAEKRNGAVKGAHVPSVALPEHEVATIRSALTAIDPDCERDLWIRMGMALHSTGAGEQAFAVWDEWSATAREKYPGTQALRRQWASFARKAEEVRLVTLFWAAQERGWSGQVEELGSGRVLATMPQVATLAPSVERPWSDPEWIWGRGKVLPFPIDTAYPERLWWMREWVKALGYVFQMPIDFPAAVSIALAAGSIGNRFMARVPRVPFREHAPLWFVVAAPSGTGKSLVFSPLVKPFERFEEQLDDRRTLAEWQGQVEYAEIQHKKAAREAAKKADDATKRRLLETSVAKSLLLDARPQAGNVLLSDATTPAMVAWLSTHSGCATIADPEGGVFDHALGHGNGREARLDPWLKAYNGEKIHEERIGDAQNARSQTRTVARPLVSIAVATQPGALEGLFDNPLAAAKGFLARFCTVICPATLPEVFFRECELSAELAGHWEQAIGRMLQSPRPSEPVEIGLDEEARALFWNWGDGELRAAERSDEATANYLTTWNGKLRGKVLRIALALHCLGNEAPGASDIDAGTMQAALTWAPYLVSHNAQLGREVKNDPDLIVAERALRWIARGGDERTEFSRRDLFRALMGGNTSSVRSTDDVNAALAALAETGWVRPIGPLERRQSGPPSAKRYQAHPMLGCHFRDGLAKNVSDCRT